MGLTKQYLRYKQHTTFNIIGSGRAGAVYLPDSGRGELVAASAAQDVIIWDIRRKERLRVLAGTKHEVTCLAVSGSVLAVGYNDGSIKLWDYSTGECDVTFTGHKSAVNCLGFDKSGLRLVSGGRDTHVIVWDIVAESGLYRLHGHKGPVSAAAFINSQNVIVTASKDSYVKFWDLSTQHCFKTLTGHVAEVWDLCLLHNDSLLVTGGADSELRLWQLEFAARDPEKEASMIVKEPDLKKEKVTPTSQENITGEEKEDEDDDVLNDDNSLLKVIKVGSILRAGEGRLHNLTVDSTGRLLACHGNDTNVELFLVRTEAEVQARLAKKAKKERKRTGGGEVEVETMRPTVQEQFKRLKPVRLAGKVKSLHLQVVRRKGAAAGQATCRVLSVLNNNQMEVVEVAVGDKEAEAEAVGRLESQGHRTDVRTLAFSSDNTAVLTASSEALKIWNRTSQACVRTIPCGYALCSLFAPGDRHAIVGTKAGKLQIFDIGSGVLTEEVDAHTGEVWSIAYTADGRGIVSGSSDKTVKFWNFELVSAAHRRSEEEEGAGSTSDGGGKVLSILHTRSLQLDEGVTCVSMSGDGRLIAVALLDSTVKVFFVDTLKFFLSLYGHKLPVVCMDISTDSTLIATGSADRNMKLWGLDFGDCHKSLFAHDDTITGLRFLPNTHMVFTCGKDGQVKQWDADIFQRILTLSGHLGEVWSLAVSPNGKWLASCGKDRTVRLWEKTGEVVVLDDERETEREAEAEDKAGESQPVPGEQGKETSLPSRRTAETERGAERLMEAIQLYKECGGEEWTKAGGEGGQPPQLPPLMLAYGAESPVDYMCGTVCRIKSSELEETLLVLPLDVVQELLDILLLLVSRGKEVELVSRCLLFLLEVHHGPILANKSFESTVIQLKESLGREVTRLRDMAGTNLAGLRFLSGKLAERTDVELFADATQRVREKNKKKKKKERALQRAVMAL